MGEEILMTDLPRGILIHFGLALIENVLKLI